MVAEEPDGKLEPEGDPVPAAAGVHPAVLNLQENASFCRILEEKVKGVWHYA